MGQERAHLYAAAGVAHGTCCHSRSRQEQSDSKGDEGSHSAVLVVVDGLRHGLSALIKITPPEPKTVGRPLHDGCSGNVEVMAVGSQAGVL